MKTDVATVPVVFLYFEVCLYLAVEPRYRHVDLSSLSLKVTR
jgi:hypothetical protein